MKPIHTLQQILSKYDEYFIDVNWNSKKGTMSIRDFLKQSIKDALEAVQLVKRSGEKDKRNTKSCSCEYVKGKRIGQCLACFQSHLHSEQIGYNQATTQYDENVKAFLREEVNKNE